MHPLLRFEYGCDFDGRKVRLLMPSKHLCHKGTIPEISFRGSIGYVQVNGSCIETAIYNKVVADFPLFQVGSITYKV